MGTSVGTAVNSAVSMAGAKAAYSAEVTAATSSESYLYLAHYLKLYYVNGSSPTYLGDTLEYNCRICGLGY